MPSVTVERTNNSPRDQRLELLFHRSVDALRGVSTLFEEPLLATWATGNNLMIPSAEIARDHPVEEPGIRRFERKRTVTLHFQR